MKTTLLLLYYLFFCVFIYAQENPVTIVKKEDGKKVTLIAQNRIDQPFELKLTIKSNGMNIPSLHIIEQKIAGKQSLEMITIVPEGDGIATYSYSLSAKPAEGNVVSTEFSRKSTSSKTLIGNSSRLRAEEAEKNVKENIDPQGVTIFIKDDCDRCDFLVEYLTENKISHQLYNISKDDNNQLMWDTMFVYEQKEGRITLPVVLSKGKLYHSIEDLENEVKNIFE